MRFEPSLKSQTYNKNDLLMSYAIINARRYFVLLNYQYGLKRKKK